MNIAGTCHFTFQTIETFKQQLISLDLLIRMLKLKEYSDNPIDYRHICKLE